MTPPETILRHPGAPRDGSGWARLWRHPRWQHYNRLVVAVAAFNLALLAMGLTRWQWWQADGIDLQVLADLAIANFAVAVLVRQQRVVNALFWLATRPSVAWPLWLRWNLGKVFHFGGLHSGCANAGSLWFLLFTGSAAWQLDRGLPGASAGVLAISGALVLVLAVIIASAQPAVRRRFHNGFELVHRFGGWTALLLVWLQLLLFVNDQRGGVPLGPALLAAPAVWLLAAMTLSVISPWLTLRRIPIRVVTPSSHAAIVTLDHGARAFPGSTTTLSFSPLAEWHAFANIPSPGTRAYRLIISRAGDWTGRFIDEKPTHVWTKGIVTAGVANIETLFRKVVYVATGSGIGPVLPHLIGPRVPTSLIWATRNPRQTYGDALVDEILAAQPDALIWDTDARGKPDLSALALAACRQHGAEAVIVISNQKLTERVVWDLESRGIPAFGAIWDS